MQPNEVGNKCDSATSGPSVPAHYFSLVALINLYTMENTATKISLRGRIVGMREEGASISATARQLGLTRTTVHKWCSRWEEAGDLRDLPRCRGPRN